MSFPWCIKENKHSCRNGWRCYWCYLYIINHGGLIYDFILTPLNRPIPEYCSIHSLITTLVQFVEMVLKKCMPPLYVEALVVYLPLITTNCAVLGIALTNVQNSHNLIESFVSGLQYSCWFYNSYRNNGWCT